MKKRRKALLLSLIIAVLVVTAIIMLNLPPSAPASQTLPTIPKIPPKLLVVPEAPFGTIGIILVCFLALFVVLRKPKMKSV